MGKDSAAGLWNPFILQVGLEKDKRSKKKHPYIGVSFISLNGNEYRTNPT